MNGARDKTESGRAKAVTSARILAPDSERVVEVIENFISRIFEGL